MKQVFTKNQTDEVQRHSTKLCQLPSGSSSRKGVEVQVLSSAPKILKYLRGPLVSERHFFLALCNGWGPTRRKLYEIFVARNPFHLFKRLDLVPPPSMKKGGLKWQI